MVKLTRCKDWLFCAACDLPIMVVLGLNGMMNGKEGQKFAIRRR